jgi:NAD(P)-dependent dehydrogenase (short-subunit alcohol dehydrogenase family)
MTSETDLNPGEAAAPVAWVTGAARGMGLRHVERLRLAGYRTAAFDLDRSGAEPSDAGVGTYYRVDVTDEEALAAAARSAADALGPVTAVVVNAGISSHKTPARLLSGDQWRRVIETNLTGAFLTAKHAIPFLVPGGTITFVASVSAHVGYPNAAEYNTSKHGLIGLMKTLANELAADGIRVNALSPGWVETPMLDVEAATMGVDPAMARLSWRSQHLLDRLVQPDDVSDVLLWLVSDQARMVTGQAIGVDGGLLAKSPTSTPALS